MSNKQKVHVGTKGTETLENFSIDTKGRQIVMYENMVVRELMTREDAIERFGGVVHRLDLME